MKKIWILSMILALLLCGCAQQAEQPLPQQSAGTEETPAATQNAGDYFSDRDFETSYSESSSVRITFDGSTVEAGSQTVQADDAAVTITREGTYLLTGNWDNGTVIVDAQKTDKVRLVLDGVSIHSQTGAALFIRQADKVFITTAEGSQNSLSNGGTFENTEENIDAAVYAKDDVTFNGAGNLTVISPAGHGIVSKDSLTVTSGAYEITCAGHALEGKDDVAVAGGTFILTAGKDGIHAENADDATLGSVYISGGDFAITSEGDGISAAASVQITDGDFTILAGGGSVNGTKASSDNWGGFMGGGPGGRGERPGGDPGNWENTEDTADSTSMKGIKAGTELTVTGGSFTIDAADDGIHSNGSAWISGGDFTVCTGDDGIHAEETLAIDGAQICITESYEGLEAYHIQILSGQITLNATDDGLNAAGGNDESGFTGGRDGMFGGRPGGMGGPGGMQAGDGSVTISGGTLCITASGDGIDANGSLTVSGGHTTVCTPTRGDTATLDYDTEAVITGGTFIGTGKAGMAQTFSDTQQGTIAIQANNQAAGTRIVLTDGSGQILLEYAPTLDFAVVIFSSPQIQSGETYTLTVGSQSADVEAQ